MESEFSQVHKFKRIYQTFLSKLMFFYKQCSYHEEISEKTTDTNSDDSENSY